MPFLTNKSRSAVERSKGYALLEVMIAVALIGLALPSLMLGMNQVMDHTADTKIDSIAYWVAYNQLENVRLEYRLSDRLLKGQTTGQAEMAGQRWEWRVTSEQSQLPGMWRLTADVGLEPNEPLVSVVGFVQAADESQNSGRN